MAERVRTGRGRPVPRRLVAGPARATAAIAVLGATLLAGCDTGHGAMMGAVAAPTRFTSNGERLYFTGISESGDPVAYSGGTAHLRMMGGGCATCHGADRSGGRLMPEFWKVAPPLTRDALFERHPGGDGHDGHDAYDDESLRRAVFEGIAPDGHPLDRAMPRWAMSERDWRDLVAYLRR